MARRVFMAKVDKKLLTVKLSYSETSNRFFIDFWDINESTLEAKCLISMSISKAEAEGISKETGIKIFCN